MNCEEILLMVVGGKTILEFEYSKYLSNGDSILGSPIVSEDSSLSIISLGVPNISGTKVIVIVTAISSGKANVTCKINTTQGSIGISEQSVFVK